MDTGNTYSYYISTFSLSEEGDKRYSSTSDTVVLSLPEYNGFFNVDGILYCYEDGVLLRDKTVNNLYFDINGQYTSGNPQLDEYVRSITASCTSENMSQLRKFRALYDWVMDTFEYEAIEYIDEVPGWEKNAALEIFKTGYGNCFSYAAAVAVLGRNVGLDANAVTGDCNQTYIWLYHGWTEVNYNGKTYLCDAEMEGEFAPVRDLDWDLFMKEYGTTPTQYEKYETEYDKYRFDEDKNYGYWE